MKKTPFFCLRVVSRVMRPNTDSLFACSALQGLQQVTTCYRVLVWATIVYHGLPWAAVGYHGLPCVMTYMRADRSRAVVTPPRSPDFLSPRSIP
jgi:hypothetical protein